MGSLLTRTGCDQVRPWSVEVEENTSTSPLRKSLQATYRLPPFFRSLGSTPICGNPITRATPGMPVAPPKYGAPTSMIARDGANVLPPSFDEVKVMFAPSFQIA